MNTLTEDSLFKAVMDIHNMVQDHRAKLGLRPMQLLLSPAQHRQALKLLFFKGRMAKRAGARGRKHSLNWRIK